MSGSASIPEGAMRCGGPAALFKLAKGWAQVAQVTQLAQVLRFGYT